MYLRKIAPKNIKYRETQKKIRSYMLISNDKIGEIKKGYRKFVSPNCRLIGNHEPITLIDEEYSTEITICARCKMEI